MTTRDAAVEGKFAVGAEGLFTLKSERRPQGIADLRSAGPSPQGARSPVLLHGIEVPDPGRDASLGGLAHNRGSHHLTQPGDQEHGIHEVTGSIPVSSTNSSNELARRP